jgi:hypothetical protein
VVFALRGVALTMNGWIGVDLDGTLAEYHGWPQDGSIGKPIPAMVERVKAWLDEGKDIRIFTARVWPWGTKAEADAQRVSDASRQIDRITEWCVEYLGRALPITCVKDYGMVALWDDRAVQVIPNTGKTIAESIFTPPQTERA